MSLTKVILGWRFSLNFMTILNARNICILTLGQRRSMVSAQITIDAQMRLNQYDGPTLTRHTNTCRKFYNVGTTLVQRCTSNANGLPTVLTIFQRWANVIMLSGLRVRLRHMNECRIFHNINSITFLLYTLTIFILRLIMLLTSTSKYAQRFKWPQFTSNPTFPMAKGRVHTHAKPNLLARNGKRR